MTQKPTILDEAALVTSEARQWSYGTPADNHGRTAALWSAYLGIPISTRQVCMLNILQKISRDANKLPPDASEAAVRESNRSLRDNLVDIAGYARNAEILGDGQ